MAKDAVGACPAQGVTGEWSNAMPAEGRLRLALVASLLSLPGGCAEPGSRHREAVLVASPQPYERDIPLPRGFRLVEKSSEDWSSGPLRYLRHRYRGRADKVAVFRFYREQMPLVRWTQISEGNVHGRYSLRFERKTEACRVTIEDRPSIMLGQVIIEVLISPAGQRPAGPASTKKDTT